MGIESYIIRGGDYGTERLKILSDTLCETSKSLLLKAGLKTGLQALDVGSGSGDMTYVISSIIGPDGKVTGVDIDKSVIELAKQNFTAENLEFKVEDIFDITSESENYDIIYSRFLMSHLPNPVMAIEHLKSKLKPGGALVIEDVEFSGHFCYPACHSFDRYVELYTAAAKARGVDPYIGCKLFGIFYDSGFNNIDLGVINPVFNSGVGKLMGILTMYNIAHSVIESGLAEKTEVEEILSELERFTYNEKSIISIPRIFQLIGYK